LSLRHDALKAELAGLGEHDRAFGGERLAEQDAFDAGDEPPGLFQSSPTKAHYAVQFTRYQEDGSVLSVCDSLYIFTSVDGEWKLQGRSSFGA
jgi:hypothetical protein